MLPQLVLAVLLVVATSTANTFEKFQFHLIRSNDDITPSVLRTYGLLAVKDDNSIIVPDTFDVSSNPTTVEQSGFKWYNFKFLTTLHYTQTQISSKPPNVTVWDTIPLQGCVDNRFSDTVTTISRTYTRTLLFEAGPHIFVSVLGLEVGVLAHLGYFNARDEKLTCDIGPGQRLQLHSNIATMNVDVNLQRNITVVKKFLGSEQLIFSEWFLPTDPSPLTFQSTSLACVTNLSLLQC